MNKLSILTSQFNKALERLEEVLAQPKTSIVRDSAIQRFEFTMDLAWKTLKAFLEEHKGVVCNSPKDCFRQAYQNGIIEYDNLWIAIIDMRNETVHTYNEETAEIIFGKLPETCKLFRSLQSALQVQQQ